MNREINDIIANAAMAGGVSVEEILSRSRRSEVVFPRHLAMSEVRRIFGLPTKVVGQIFDRNHATIIYACAVVENAKSIKDPYSKEILNKYSSVNKNYKWK